MPGNPYKLLIFDWDGTLMDSAERIVASLRVAIRQAGMPERDDRQLRHIIGLGLDEAVTCLYPDGIDAGCRRRLIDAYRFQFLEANTTPSCLFDGVAVMLKRFVDQGYRLAIATGKSRKGLNRSLREQGMEKLFPVSRCADESGSKPDPAMLIEILNECKVSVDDALMIGDTEFDMEMARRAGVDAVAVMQGVHDEQQLRRAQPLVILDHIGQLPDWLDRRILSGAASVDKAG